MYNKLLNTSFLGKGFVYLRFFLQSIFCIFYPQSKSWMRLMKKEMSTDDDKANVCLFADDTSLTFLRMMCKR